MTRRWIDVAPVEEVQERRPLPVQAAGVSLVLVRIDGALFAVVDRCPHMSFPLSEGFVSEEGRLVCSRHHWEFELREPDPRVPPELRCHPLPLRERRGRVEVLLSEDLTPGWSAREP